MEENLIKLEREKMKTRKLVFKDAFTLARIIKKTNLKNILNLKSNNFDEEGNEIPLTKEEMMMRFAEALFEELDVIEVELYSFFSSLTGKTEEEVSNFTFAEIMDVIQGMFGDSESNDFFERVSKLV
ncbi:MAG: hypothetical protein RR440_00295 [Erysipelotrichaceae bacterium]